MAWTQNSKFSAASAAQYDDLGWSIARSGDTIVVGAIGDDTNAASAGAAYVFVKTAGVWTLQQKLFPSTSYWFGFFGWDVSIDGDTIVVGSSAWFAAEVGAYVFTRTGAVWTEQQKLVPADFLIDPGTFGHSVSVEGDTVAIGAYVTAGGGSVYIFTRAGAIWSEGQKLAGSVVSAFGYFGESVHLSGDWLAISAPLDDSIVTQEGSVFAFKVAAGIWTEQQKLITSDAAVGDRLCFRSDSNNNALALNGTVLVAGCERASTAIGGAAYVFSLSGGVWTEQQKLLQSVRAGDGAFTEKFGRAVATDGTRVAIGAGETELAAWAPDVPGAVYVYSNSGGIWSADALLFPTRVDPLIGGGVYNTDGSLSLAGSELLVGGYGDDAAHAASCGAVYYFTLENNPTMMRLPMAGLYIDEVRGIKHT